MGGTDFWRGIHKTGITAHAGGQRSRIFPTAQRQSQILMLSSFWDFEAGQQWSCSDKIRISIYIYI